MSFAKMIRYFYPDAAEGIDFTLERTASGEINVASWNENKLGKLPELRILHSRYMEFLRRQKELSPKTDATDPAPWFNKVPDSARVSRDNALKIPLVDVDFKSGFVVQHERVEE